MKLRHNGIDGLITLMKFYRWMEFAFNAFYSASAHLATTDAWVSDWHDIVNYWNASPDQSGGMDTIGAAKLTTGIMTSAPFGEIPNVNFEYLKNGGLTFNE